MDNLKRVLITLIFVSVLLSACVSTGDKRDARSGAATVATERLDGDKTCMAKREWAGMKFNAVLSRDKNSRLNVSVDMSETPWSVGVVEAWLETGGKKILSSQSSAGAVVEHESSNTPAMVGVAGMIFDGVRNSSVGGKSKIGTAIAGTTGIVMAEKEAQARRQKFDRSTTVWSGTFDLDEVDCKAKLLVRYWLPETGVAGQRGVDVGHCFCSSNSP